LQVGKHVLLLVPLAALAIFGAGCGGPNARAIALKQASKELHPRVLRIETVPPNPVDGVSYALALVKADSAFGLRCLPVPGHGSRICHPHYAVIPVALNGGDNVTDPGAVSGKFGLTGSQVAAIAKARKANPRFSRFPDIPGWTRACTIPRLTGGTISGNCDTEAQPPSHVRYVNFYEYWKVKHGWKQDHWIVTFNRDGSVRSIHYMPRLTPAEILRLLK
jgi:hypothetical protein